VIRTVAELALHGADVSGSNTPGATAYAAYAVKVNRWASDRCYFEAASIGPRLEREPEPEVEPQWTRPASLPPSFLPSRKKLRREQDWTPKTLKLIYKLELESAERFADAGKRRKKTSEYRDEKTGEYGAVAVTWPNGVVAFAPSGLPVVIKRSPDDVQDDERLTVGQGTGLFPAFKPDKVDALIAAALRGDPDAWSGKKVKGVQTAPPRRKPGPKPQHDGTPKELARLRQIKRRCKQRGIPFVIEEHLQRMKLQREKLHVITASSPPPSGGEQHGHVGTRHQRDPRSLEGRSENTKRKTAR
jgi:hypothetical protein